MVFPSCISVEVCVSDILAIDARLGARTTLPQHFELMRLNQRNQHQIENRKYSQSSADPSSVMHRPNRNGNQRSQRGSHPPQIEDDDDSRSQVDSDTSEEDPAPTPEGECSPFVSSDRDQDVDEYVKRLRKTGGTADEISRSALNQGMGMIAVKTGATYMARFGRLTGKGGTDDIVDEDDIIGGGVAVATKLNPAQQQMMNSMAPQASGAAAGGIAAPMMSVVVPTPLGSAMASSAATTVRCYYRVRSNGSPCH